MASISAQVWSNIIKNTKNADFKKTAPPPAAPHLLAPLGVKKIFGTFLASMLALVWRNITKNTKNADFKKTDPPAALHLLAPLAPPEDQKKF